MLQKPLVVCSGGLSGLIFALSLSDILVTKKISGKILLYHEDYKIRNSKNQLFLVNEPEFSHLPKGVRDYISPTAVLKEIFFDQQAAYYTHEFEDRLLELIIKLHSETVQLIHVRFDPARTNHVQYDLLILADGYNIDLCDNYRFKKEVISKNYELEVCLHLTENHLQDNEKEIEILSLIQTRYLMQLQQNNQNFLKINLSKSEYDSIELNPSLDSIKNNPWFMNIIRDGLQFFQINNCDLVSISKSSNDSFAAKEFYRSYQQYDQNERFVCAIGDAAFDSKSWQIRSKLGIAISTATTLTEQLTVDQVLLEINRNNLDKFSNTMLNFQKELVHKYNLTNMENILLKVIHSMIGNYNEKESSEERNSSSINSFDFIATLNKYPQLFEIDHTFDYKSASVLDELREKYIKNIKTYAEIFLKKLNRIQSMVNFFTICESYLSLHTSESKNVGLNENDWVELSSPSILQDLDSKVPSIDQNIKNNNTSDTSSEDSDNSSDEDTQSESSDDLSLKEFFRMTFGEEPINYDATNFVTDELTEEVFKIQVESSLKDPTKGVLRNIFPYIVDIINRTIPLQRIQDCIQQVSVSRELDDPSQIFKRLANCKGRDYLVAFLDKVPKKAISKILLSLTRASIPIPLLFANEFSQKGLRVLKEIRSLILRDKYHLLLSFNLSTSESVSPFTKKLYPIICQYREDDLSITSADSIDMSFHPASENNGRKPVAIAEVYFEENAHQIFLSLINSFSQFAFYMFLHVYDQDFEGNSPSNELNQLIKAILPGSSDSNDSYTSKISVIYWNKSRNKDKDPFSKRKKNLNKLLEPYFKPECIKIEQISKDMNQFIEKKKDDVMKQLSKPEAKIIYPQLILKLSDKDSLNIWRSEIKESSFASKMESIHLRKRSDIFHATRLEHEIEALNDKKSTTESKENAKFMSEGEILIRIQQCLRKQLEIGSNPPLSIFADFAELINENNIEKIRDFAGQIDDFFKKYLCDLQNSERNIERTEIKQKIEECDISIHDFWLEFIILSELRSSNKSVLEQLYNVNPQKLQGAYRTWILEGEPLQLLDGLSLRSLPTKFLSNVLSNLMTNVERRLIVISVIGLESSGKSTLLNYLFHCGFATSASRCTKGVYMSYRSANFNGNTIDLLILDSEGMASTAQKYITHRTSFDKKITLLALMCSQIVIINTKGLTRDIGDILEVSSWHLDALRHRQSKPRLHFVLRDMVDTIEAQVPAFKDIVDGLEKMFKQIPGCVDSLEDFMSVGQDDVHLLENAFSFYKDDFRPRIANIGRTENVNLPAEVFPAKISRLRQSLLKSALLQTNATEHFTNVQGFIPHMKTVWSKINTYGSFLHFENFKAIQAWHQMRYIVSIIQEKKLPEFVSRARNIINDYIEKIEGDYLKWNQVESEFRMELDLLTNNWRNDNIKYYSELVQEQFDVNIVEEGKRLINNMIAEERREQDAQWMSLARDYKDSWLSACAIEKIGKRIKGLNTGSKINETECTKIFEDIWKEVDNDKKEFNRQMVLQSEKLKQHVQEASNNAINDFISTVRQNSERKEKEKFKRVFWTSLKQPSTLEEYIDMDVQQIQKIIEIKMHFNLKSFVKSVKKQLFDLSSSITIPSIIIPGSKFATIGNGENFANDMSKPKIAEEIKRKLMQTIEVITYDLIQKLSLHIEQGQAVKWLETLCACLFEFTQPPYNIEFKTGFDFFEKFLRSRIYITLRDNTVEWEKQQKEKLDVLKKNLLSSFRKILTDLSNESLSKEILKYIVIAFEKQTLAKVNSISRKLQIYLKDGWMNTYTATNYAYKQSFDALNINAIRDYLENPTDYIYNLFNTEYDNYSEILVDYTLREIDESYKNTKESLLKAISGWSELFDPNCKYNHLPLSAFLLYLPGSPKEYNILKIFMRRKHNVDMTKAVPEYNLSDILKDVNNLFGSITVENPVDFCNTLSSCIKEGLEEMQTEWIDTERSETEKKMWINLVKEKTTWNKLGSGCSARCPLCSSKCELPNDGHGSHKVSNHLLPAFYGVCSEIYRYPILTSCTEDETHKKTWSYSNKDSKLLSLDDFLQKHHADWYPLQRSEPSDENIMKMRAVWFKLRQELCLKYKMIDNTDPSWGPRYGSLIPE